MSASKREASLQKFENFLLQASEEVAVVGKQLETLTSKYASVLEYFGEEELKSDALFTTLMRFSLVFKATAEAHVRQIKREAANEARAAKAAVAKSGRASKDDGMERERSFTGLGKENPPKQKVNRRQSIM